MEVMREILELHAREHAGARLRDISASAESFRSLSPDVERAARQRRGALLEELGEAKVRARLGAFLGRKTRDFLRSEHPFVEIEPGHERVLAALYAALLAEVARCLALPGEWTEAAAALRSVLGEHQQRLRALVGALLVDSGAPPDDRERICAEYSPELQLRVLGVEEEALPAPILDLGCGASGALVRRLRALGRAPVVGVDLRAPAGADFVRGSWFAVDLAAHRWQTVIAHQSFSLHFLYAHLHSERRAARFAQRYVEILRALAPGGRFLYVPGLPFFEAVLPAGEFRVSTALVGETGVSAKVVERLGRSQGAMQKDSA